MQNLTGGVQLKFQGQNWTLKSGTVTINGTFTLSNNVLNAIAVTRSAAVNNTLQPDAFSGNVAIEGNKVTFTNFTGNWYAVFATWYQKQ